MQPQLELAPPADAPAQTMAPDAEGRARWNATLKIAFRFAFSCFRSIVDRLNQLFVLLNGGMRRSPVYSPKSFSRTDRKPAI